MDERRDPFDVRLDALARELADLRRRLDRLEAQSGAAGPAAAEPAAAPAAELVAGPDAAGSPFAGGPAGAIALAGRTFVALGGAFLLRAATDAGYVPGAAGAMAGIVYATAWLVAGERAAAAGRRASAAVHGLTAVMIAYPLIWETTARFEMLPTVGAAAALVVFLALSLVLACRHALGAVASASVVFAALASLGLLVRTRDLPTFTVALLVVAAAVEGLALRDRWLALRWPAALALDLGIGAVLIVEEREGGVPEGYPVLSPEALAVIGLALAAVYLASLGLRTIRQGRPVTPFEIVQTPVALLLGLGLGTSAMVASGVPSSCAAAAANPPKAARRCSRVNIPWVAASASDMLRASMAMRRM